MLKNQDANFLDSLKMCEALQYIRHSNVFDNDMCSLNREQLSDFLHRVQVSFILGKKNLSDVCLKEYVHCSFAVVLKKMYQAVELQ